MLFFVFTTSSSSHGVIEHTHPRRKEEREMLEMSKHINRD